MMAEGVTGGGRGSSNFPSKGGDTLMDTILDNVTFADVLARAGEVWQGVIVVGLIASIAGINLGFRLFRKVKGAAR